MGSPSLAPRRSRGRFVLKTIGFLLLLVLITVGVTATWFDIAAHRALPQLDGTVRLPGLTAPVAVIRDYQGVPHIRAANMHDLLFAQGFVTAQDRLWQMDMTRRYGNGDLAEILGPDYIKSDRIQRILGLRQVADRAAAEMSADDRSLAEAYARGVNAYITSARGRLPMEFRVLRYAPQPWTVEDSLVCGATFSEMLNLGYANEEIRRGRIEDTLPPQITSDLFPRSGFGNPLSHQIDPPQPVVPKVMQSQTSIPGWFSDLPSSSFDRPAIAQDSAPDFTPGSNNWVLSGAHTTSGKPLLSNDMHLTHHIPNTWYEVQLTAGDFDVDGVSAPGIPFVIVGHNRRIAWGFTNLNPAATDVYIETFNSHGEYQTPEGWQKPQVRHEVIQVKGAKPVGVDVVITRHGPIVSSIVPGGDSRQLALKWILYEPHALDFVPFLRIDSAADWTQFRQALALFATPGQNVVYADVDGNIGYQASGWVPVRNRGDATRPVPGNTDDYEWNGFLSLDDMPHVFDPESGIIATANNKVVADDYPYLISNEWFPPFRVDRIYHVLREDKKFDAADMLALQTDVESPFDRYLSNQFVYAVDHSSRATARAKEAADLMRGWDGEVTTASVAPTIEGRAQRELQKILLQPWLGAAWTDYAGKIHEVWLENTVLHKPARWLPKQYASWNDLLADAVDRVVARPAAPVDLRHWTWGMSGVPLFLEHPIFSRIPLLRRYAGPGLVPQSGNGNTVKQVGRTFGPSERFTADMSDLDHSTMNILTGEGGNIFSPYFMDQWNAWYRGTTYRIPFSPAAVKAARVHTLRLVP